MEYFVYKDKKETSSKAADKAAEILQESINMKGHANFVMATGASQFEFIKSLLDKDINWGKTTMFHLDEYIGLSPDHPASFRKYLKERFISKVNLGEAHLIQGDRDDPNEECTRLNEIIAAVNIDVSFVGIGENGHLAFNDPPADFETTLPYIIVDLDQACRKQQLGEGWFDSIEEVPQKAISMSINQIMRSDSIICTVPGKRKSEAVKNTLEKDVSPKYPASILKNHENSYIFLDKNSSSKLD